MKLFVFILIFATFSTKLFSASWNFKKNLDANPPYKKCVEAISNGKDLGSSALRGKSKYANYLYENFIYEIIINSSYMTCVRINLDKEQQPFPLSKIK